MHGKVTPKKKKNELFLLALQEYGSSFLDFDCISFVIQLLQTVTTSNTCSRKKKNSSARIIISLQGKGRAVFLW